MNPPRFIVIKRDGAVVLEGLIECLKSLVVLVSLRQRPPRLRGGAELRQWWRLRQWAAAEQVVAQGSSSDRDNSQCVLAEAAAVTTVSG